MKTIVAHPGKQHSYRLASALKKDGSLLFYATTFYASESSLISKVLGHFARGSNRKRLNSHRNEDLRDCDVKVFCEIGGLIEVLASRFDSSRNVYRWVHRIVSDIFGIKVAKLAIEEHADAVIAYDSNATACFRYLKKEAPEILRILDVSIAPRPFLKIVYDKEITESGRDDLRILNRNLWNGKLMKRFQQEIDDSQFFLAASDFVRTGLKWCGAADSQVLIVPYGANVSSDRKCRIISEDAPIRFLFVGQATYRKGLSYLIDAMDGLQDKAELTVTGAFNAKDWFVKNSLNKPNIEYTGFVTGDRMQRIYENSDVMVIPSFSEGMSQVGIEAMACGLPVICTTNSGVNDLITEGENGFIIEPGNQEQLKEKMEWFIEHRNHIREMGEKARSVAENYSWDRYEENVIEALHKVIDGESN